MTIPLVSEEDFISNHPEIIANDPHDLMKQRLYDERAQREALELQRKELLLKKQRLIAENKKRKEDLESLDEQLKKFIEASINFSVIYNVPCIVFESGEKERN